MQVKGMKKPNSSARAIMVTARERGRRRMGKSLKQPTLAELGVDTGTSPLGLTLNCGSSLV